MQKAQFERIVDEALEELPEKVLDALDNLHVVVEEWPTPEQDSDDTGLLGLYEGVSLLERGVDYSGFLPDRIIVFMGPHLELGLSRQELKEEIRRTVLHEVAHHLGIDDRRLHDLGWD
ncbi:MAG: metallopeptidase family protein [Acidimicrobiia bacterium]